MSLFVITAVEAERGDATINADGTLSYSVPADFTGDTITCTVEGKIVIKSKAVDLPPVTGPDSATVMAGGSITIDVLANDVDPEGKALTVTGATTEQGSVTVTPESLLSYTAPIGFSGTATIAYTAADPAGNETEGTVTVDVLTYVPADLPPLVAADRATVVAGATLRIDALENDVDPEGKALTITAATADRGNVSITPESLLSYTAPAGFSGTATITYTAADPAGNKTQGKVTVEVFVLSVVEGDVEGEFVVSSAPGSLTVTVVEPAEYAGEYSLQTSDLAGGPVNLVPPRISGSATVGGTLTAQPALWAFAEADAPLDVSRQWMRGDTGIVGAVGETYVVDAADAGRTISLVETAGNVAGSRETASEGLAIPAAPSAAWSPAALPGLAVWVDASDAGAATLSGGQVARIADKSGNGRDLVPPQGAPAPTLDASIGGKPALRFPAGSVLKTADGVLPSLPGMPGVTVIAVTQGNSATAFKECFGVRNATAASGEHVAMQTGYSMMWFGNGNRYWTNPASGPVISAAMYPAKGTHGGTEWWRNGTKLNPTSTAKVGSSVSLPANAYFKLGNQDGESSEQAECLLVIGPLSSEDREKAEGYLAHKWGLAGQLPGTHPYKAGPPA